METVNWRKASRSTSNGTQCVEIAVVENVGVLNEN